MYIRESKTEDTLIREVKKRGGFCRKLKFIGYNGAPDRLVAYRGATFFVETKPPKKYGLRPAQILCHKDFASQGIDVVVLKTAEEAKLWVELQFSVLEKAR